MKRSLILRSPFHPFLVLGVAATAVACSDAGDGSASNAALSDPIANSPTANQPAAQQASPDGSGEQAVPANNAGAVPSESNVPPANPTPSQPVGAAPIAPGSSPGAPAAPNPTDPATQPAVPGESTMMPGGPALDPSATNPAAPVPDAPAVPPAAGGAAAVEFACGDTEVALATVLFSAGMSSAQLGGWNHGGSVDQAFSGEAYSTTPNNKVQNDASCAGSSTWQSTLVKKYHDWDMQHVNGMEFNGMQLPVSSIGTLVVELRLDPTGTKVPTPDTVLAHFQPFMSAADVPWDAAKAQALDNGNATLLLDLAESGAGPETRILKAKFKISVPPADFGKWLRFEVPASDLEYFFFHNWAPTTISHADAVATGKTLTKGLLFAELESEGSIRAVVNSADGQKGQAGWAALNPRPAPLYAEHAVSVRTIGFTQ